MPTATPSSRGRRDSLSLVREAPPITCMVVDDQTTAGGGATGSLMSRRAPQLTGQRGGGVATGSGAGEGGSSLREEQETPRNVAPVT